MGSSAQVAYKERVSAFWDQAREEYSWWCSNYGPAVGATMFWQLAETRWMWKTIALAQEVKEEALEPLQEEAMLADEWGGHTDGVWTYDDDVKVVALTTPMALLPGEAASSYDKSWVTYTVPDECPF